MSSEEYIINKFDLNIDNATLNPIEIPNVGRADLAKLLNELGLKSGVEIGVAGGEYSEILTQNNPQMKLYGVDPYTPYRQYTDYVRTSTFKNLRETAEKRLSTYKNYEFIYKFSADAVKDFADNKLDFVYIDGNHREPFVTQDITEWSKRVRSGGIVSGHDFARVNGSADNWVVREAVLDYAAKHGLKLFVLGLKNKVPGLVRDGIRSWMWVKP